jgi:hypothetical protein
VAVRVEAVLVRVEGKLMGVPVPTPDVVGVGVVERVGVAE